MRRADRLFQIVERLRRRSTVITARELADEFGVSERTIYRDISDLCVSGVAIEGEAGVGYRLPRGSFDLPPMMFSAEEIEALVLGSRVVEAWGDVGLARAAQQAVSKIEAVIPRELRKKLRATPLFAVNSKQDISNVGELLSQVRSALNSRHKVTLNYKDKDGATTLRTLWPLGLFYWAPTWTLGAYCELREGFRNFRLDRITALEVGAETFPIVTGRTVEDLIAFYQNE
jgi:predicted DNA-binding transcriptional regulator YafY